MATCQILELSKLNADSTKVDEDCKILNLPKCFQFRTGYQNRFLKEQPYTNTIIE